MRLEQNDDPLDDFELIRSGHVFRPDPEHGKVETVAEAYIWFDWDSYRWLDVWHHREGETDWSDPDERVQTKWLSGTTRLLRSFLDAAALPPDVLALNISLSGEISWTSTDDKYNGAWCTYYPSVEEYRLPSSARNLPVLRRSDLTELDRIEGTATKVSYRCSASGQEKIGAFKAMANCPRYGGVWDEIQIRARLPAHPLILPIDSLVVEELTGLGVVGFTTPFISAHSLDKPLPGPFKLRWLRELMGLVDELNLEYGVVHQGICPQNLLINPDTDSILLFDFMQAARVGDVDNSEGPRKRIFPNFERPEINDIKGVAFLLYSVITRDPAYRHIRFDHIKDDEFDDLAKWTQHPPAQLTPLDHPITTFHAELTAWMRKRRAQAASGDAKPTRPVDALPAAPSPPSDMHFPSPPTATDKRYPAGLDPRWGAFDTIGVYQVVTARLEAGRPVLQWQRPSRGAVDKGRRLLATGRYADEEAEYQRRMASEMSTVDPKRGFPQPMRRVTRSRAKARADFYGVPAAVSAAAGVNGGGGGGGAAVGKKRKRVSGTRERKR